MAKRDNHYEAAFENFLRREQTPYVAVDEARRSLLGGKLLGGDGAATHSLKNLDFIVPAQSQSTWLVDVKGRRFPSGRRLQYWKNWSTGDDLASLSRWESLFGSRFLGLLVFAYEVVGDRAPVEESRLFVDRGVTYGFVGIRLTHYLAHARPLSPRWGTVAMSAPAFRRLARPLEEFL